ncbi:hypothetical protein [Desulfurella sp.]|uniref:hypothetical protein n=1 Tax=Desulfurella sp. TaxID=1962857 RepID=UPI0025C26F88|nr:hypothetical protein [Desulfurella sp.]
MDIFKINATRNGSELYFIPFPELTSNTGFHFSMHNQNYGMHLKLTKPKVIQSRAIKYEDLINMIKRSSPSVLRQIMRLPRGHHNYFLVIPYIDQNAFYFKGDSSRTKVGINEGVLKGFEVIEKSDSFFIPRDFDNVAKEADINSVFAIIPDTNEITFFKSVDSNALGYFSDISEALSNDIIYKLGGIFITYNLTDSRSLIENFPELWEIFEAFYQELIDNHIQIFDEGKINDFFNYF